MKNSEEKTLISIIMPTYNRADLISRAINSVLKQTISNWELIVIDDCSTDDTEKLIKNFQEKDKRISFIKLEKNSGGASKPRNVGLGNIKTEYVAFLDSDDEWLPEKLEKQLKVFQEGEKRLGLVFTGAIFINEKNKKTRIKRAKARGNIFLEELAYNPIGSPSRVMIKSECVKFCGNFDESLLALEDWDYWVRISKDFLIDSIDEQLVLYYEQNDSLSIDQIKLTKGYEKFWTKYNIDSCDKWIRAIHYARLGHRLCFYNQIIPGRKYLLRALRIEPWKIKYIFIFLLSLFGSRIYSEITFLIMKNSK